MSKKIVVVVLFSCVCICLCSKQKLVEDLFLKYERRLRPVRNESTITTVGVEMTITRLLEVNGKEEYIKLIMALKQSWDDEFLKWDPEKYDGIEEILLPASMVWLPDIFIITTSNEDVYLTPQEDTLLILHYTGMIEYSYVFIHHNTCPMESQKFPFDSQKCVMKVTSWKHSDSCMLLEHTLAENPKPRNANTEWEIFPYTNESKIWPRDLTNHNYSQVWYTVKIKRRSTYYVWVIMVPTFVISALCIAGIFGPFNISSERSEKITLGLTTLLTLSVILSLVTGDMPKGQSLPVMGIFVLLELVICTSSMSVSVMIMYLHQRAHARGWIPPKWLLLKSQVQEVAKRRNAFQDQYRNSTKGNSSNGIQGNNSNGKVVVKEYETMDLKELRNTMVQVTEALAPMRNYLEKIEADESRKEQWALTFDRLDVIFFIAFQIISVLPLIYIYIASSL